MKQLKLLRKQKNSIVIIKGSLMKYQIFFKKWQNETF